MIELTQDQIVELFIEKMRLHGPSNTGTYNKADPTHYEKGTAKIGLAYGFCDTFDEEEPIMSGYPAPENVTVNWHDVTWGVEFGIITSIGVQKGYWSRPIMGDEPKWLRTTDKFFEVFKRILIEGQEEDFWSKNDDLAAMGYYSCK